ncbi:MAG TPA: signal peptidase I [Acidobacteriaceae bacterium]|jgi:signal peptidase I|nr:signal peptidase I [Acidobacteriaceae bacterium]
MSSAEQPPLSEAAGPGEAAATRWDQYAREPAARPHPVAHGPGLLDIVRSLTTVVVIALFILTFIVQPFRIPSESMEHTLLVGDFLLVDKTTFAPPGMWAWLLPYRTIRRRDIVVFHYPPNPPEHVVKRVIGLPGDRIHLESGAVWVNGVEITEPYVAYEPAYADDFRDNFPTPLYSDPGVNPQWWMEMRREVRGGDLVVPAGDYFVLGDNRNFSLDSRYWGFVTQDHIVGRPLVVYFSLREPSATDAAQDQDDRLGQKSVLGRMENFARWERFLRIVR